RRKVLPRSCSLSARCTGRKVVTTTLPTSGRRLRLREGRPGLVRQRGEAARLGAGVRDRQHGCAHDCRSANGRGLLMLDVSQLIDPALAADAKTDRLLLQRNHDQTGTGPEEE